MSTYASGYIVINYCLTNNFSAITWQELATFFLKLHCSGLVFSKSYLFSMTHHLHVATNKRHCLDLHVNQIRQPREFKGRSLNE
jgi:hypothetical protein